MNKDLNNTAVKLPTQELLHDCLEYRDGVLFWKRRPENHFKTIKVMKMWNTKNAGNQAGYVDSNGYLHLKINGKKISVHRVVFAMFNGYYPNVTDHINRDRLDNRIENLRDVTQEDNNKNLSMHKRNTSGVCGVCFDKSRGKWKAFISVDKKPKNLGRFDNFEDAKEARLNAIKKYGYEVTHGQ